MGYFPEEGSRESCVEFSNGELLHFKMPQREHVNKSPPFKVVSIVLYLKIFWHLACHVNCFPKLNVSSHAWTRFKGGMMEPLLTVIELRRKKMTIR